MKLFADHDDKNDNTKLIIELSSHVCLFQKKEIYTQK